MTSSRVLARSYLFTFAISTAFPVAAGIIDDPDLPRWLGIADVAIAATLLALSFVLAGKTAAVVSDQDRLRALQVSQQILTVIPALLALFFVVGDRLQWQVLVIGLAWRGWLLFHMLPFILADLRRS